jgi:ATP-binding cassette subfamily C protein
MNPFKYMLAHSVSSPFEYVIARSTSSYLLTALFFSFGINILYLAAPIYMLQVYDRVIPSSSVVTLVMLTLVMLLAFLTLAALDVVRAYVLTRAGIRLDAVMGERVFAAIVDRSADQAARSQPLRDLDQFRQTITGQGIHGLLDLPWAPVYLGLIFILHPVLGAFALGSAGLLLGLAYLNEVLVHGSLSEANKAGIRSYGFSEMSFRNAEAIRAMGMLNGLLLRWRRDRNQMLERQKYASDRASAISGLIRFSRMAMQSLILGLGAYLVINRSITGGAMFAAMILLGRALQPIEQLVGSWRGLVAARDSYRKLEGLLDGYNPIRSDVTLPAAEGHVSVEAATYVPPGVAYPVLRNISFEVKAGEAIGIIGPSGAGKSTLARLLIGVIAPTQGFVRLDGSEVAKWPRGELGLCIGYLPQDIELFDDTVAANISRFQMRSDNAIIEAARLAGVHDIILRLPQGYDTKLGEGAAVLSGGVRQRIGLARAVFGGPSLVLLDEPSSNLDADGDAALSVCLERLKKRGTTIFLVSHRPGTISVTDKLLVLKDGMVQAFGPRSEIMARLTARAPVPLRAVPTPSH